MLAVTVSAQVTVRTGVRVSECECECGCGCEHYCMCYCDRIHDRRSVDDCDCSNGYSCLGAAADSGWGAWEGGGWGGGVGGPDEAILGQMQSRQKL